MNIRSYPLALGLALAAGTMLLAGCSPEAAPPPTTVGTDLDDSVLTARVKSAMVGTLDVKGFEIKVETRKGKVQLSGFVEDQAGADRAMRVASAVDGVRGVENGMTLKQGKATVGNTIDDGIVTAKVKSALLTEPSVKSADIGVVTRRGEVQLSGFVDNQAQIDRAIHTTRAIEGVRGVVSEMSVKK